MNGSYQTAWLEHIASSSADDDQKVLVDSLRVRLACAENVEVWQFEDMAVWSGTLPNVWAP